MDATTIQVGTETRDLLAEYRWTRWKPKACMRNCGRCSPVKAMSECANCGGAVELVKSEGGVEGAFSEKYRCNQCEAIGKITGMAEDAPREWKRTGTVFSAL